MNSNTGQAWNGSRSGECSRTNSKAPLSQGKLDSAIMCQCLVDMVLIAGGIEALHAYPGSAQRLERRLEEVLRSSLEITVEGE